MDYVISNKKLYPGIYQLSSVDQLSSQYSGFHRNNYTLTSWNTQSDGGGDTYGLNAQIDIQKTMDLYAQWSFTYPDSELAFRMDDDRVVFCDDISGLEITEYVWTTSGTWEFITTKQFRERLGGAIGHRHITQVYATKQSSSRTLINGRSMILDNCTDFILPYVKTVITKGISSSRRVHRIDLSRVENLGSDSWYLGSYTTFDELVLSCTHSTCFKEKMVGLQNMPLSIYVAKDMVEEYKNCSNISGWIVYGGTQIIGV